MIHKEQSELAGKTVKIKSEVKHFQVKDFGGAEFEVEDWWDRVSGGSWMNATGNPAAMIYGMRSGLQDLPIDDEVLYGKIGILGHLIHINEIEASESITNED